MRQLHLVGFTTDRRGLIFSVRRGAKSGGFIVDVGDDLLAAIDEARARMAELAADVAEVAATPHLDRADRPQSRLAVREIQARLRQGQSIETVAAKAGVDVDWVSRFAAPVLTEMAEIVRSVRAKRYDKQRVGTSGAALGESVYRNLVERGVTTPRDDLDKGWSARQLADGQWEVRFDYVSRGRPVSVSWSYDEATGKVLGRDRLATQLAFRPGGPSPSKRAKAAGAPAGAAAVAEAAAEDPPRPAPAKAAAKKMAAARRAARARMAADAERATRRNAAMARKAAKRKPKPIELTEIEELEELDDVAEVDALEELDVIEEVDVIEEIEEIVEDEEAVPARPRRPSVPAHRRLADEPDEPDDADADDPHDADDAVLDLAWPADDDADDDTLDNAADGAAPPTPRPRRREPLRAARIERVETIERAENGAAEPGPRVLRRRESSGPPPVFRAGMATQAGPEPASPPRAPRAGS